MIDEKMVFDGHVPCPTCGTSLHITVRITDPPGPHIAAAESLTKESYDSVMQVKGDPEEFLKNVVLPCPECQGEGS